MSQVLQADKKQHIVIVGGGMVGISLALMLSKVLPKKSVEITLVEQYPLQQSSIAKQPSFDDRSTALSAGTADLLKKIDCWACLEPYVQNIKAVHVSDKGHFGGVRLEAEKYDVDSLGYVVENKQLGRVLINQLQQRVISKAINCLAPSMVVSCMPKKSGYELLVETNSSGSNSASENKKQEQDRQQHHISADLVLVADGADSPLRTSLGIGTQSIDYKQTALIANVSLDRYHNDIAYERFTDEGPIALLPLPSLGGVHRAALVWTLPKEKAKKMKSATPENIVEQLQQRFGFRLGKITSIGARQYIPLALIEAQEQVRSHLAIVGNAAHLLHPVAGQGFNLALRDCWVLSECLCLSDRKKIPLGHYSSLKNYLSEQSMDQELTIGLTDSLAKLFSSNHLPKAVLRQFGLFSLNALPFAKNQFAQKMMGIRSL